MKFRITTLLAVIAAVAAFFATCAWLHSVFGVSLTIRNLSGENLRSVEVVVWHQKVSLFNLAPNESRTRKFSSRNFDDHFEIEVRFDDGRILKESDGYVTSGHVFPDNCEILINNESIVLNQR